jgi:hypothetical protein
MTQALAPRFPGAAVSAVEFAGVVDGTNRRASLHLRYAAGTGPEQVFLKMHGPMLNRLALLALGALTAEARLFASGVPLPIEHALPYATAFDARRLASVVLIEDVTLRGGVPNDATTPLSVAQARSGVAELARLHAAYWERPLPVELRFVRPWRLGSAWAPVSAVGLARGVRRLRGRVDREQAAALPGIRRLERQFRASAALAASGPQTLLHGDPHPGNTYSLPGERIGLYDWQLIRLGNWSHDVGYFIVSGLDVESRRKHERELLDGYLEALRDGGARPPGRDDAWERYRATPAYGLGAWLHTFSAGSFQPERVCLATLERFATAYGDLGTERANPLSR